MIYYIYRITHIPTGRFYIGQRSYKGEDWREDTYMGSGVIMKRLLKKHPLIEFRKEVLCFCRDHDQLLRAEQAAVSANFPANPLCINLCAGGRGTAGLTHSEETRARLSEIKKGTVASKETRARMSEARKGKNLSEEHRQNIAKSKIGKVPDEQTRAKIGEANRRRVVSEETKARMSESHKGKVISEETKAKMSKSQKGKTHSEETRGRLSELNRKDTVMLLSVSSDIYEVNADKVISELNAGANFNCGTVWIYNEQLGVYGYVYALTAKTLILLNVGWLVGRRASLRRVGTKDIDKATGLLKQP